MRAVRWVAWSCTAVLLMTSCGGDSGTTSAGRLRNSATTCFESENERSAAIASATSARDAAVSKFANSGDEKALSAAVSTAEQQYATLKSELDAGYARYAELDNLYYSGIRQGHNSTTSPEYQNWMKVVRESNALYDKQIGLAKSVSSALATLEAAKAGYGAWRNAKELAEIATQKVTTTEAIPLCVKDETTEASPASDESSTSSVVDESSTTSVVAESSTTSVVVESSTTSQPSTDTTISTDSTTTTSAVAPVTSDAASCEISDVTAPSQVAVGDEFEVSARYTGAGCLAGPPNTAGGVRVGMQFETDFSLLSNSCPSGNCQGVVAYRFRATSVGSGKVSVFPTFWSGDVKVQKQIVINVVSQTSTPTTSVAGGQNSDNNNAETSTTATESAALCKFSKPTAPSQVVVGEPFDITIDSSSEYCSDRVYGVVSGFDFEVRATAIFSGPKFKTFSMMIMGPGLVTFQMYYRAPEGNQKLGEFQVASVEPAKKNDVDPCGKIGLDAPYIEAISTDAVARATCDAAEGLQIKIYNRQGDVLLERVAPQQRQLAVGNLDYFLRKYGYLKVVARHLCPGRTSCGYWAGVELEQSSSDEKSATTTTTSIAESTTTTSTSVAATSTESTVAAETTTTSVAPTTTSVAPTTTTSSVPELVTPTVDSPTGQQPSTVVPVGFFSKAVEGSPAAETEVTKIAVDETAVILICDQACVGEVAAQTGADPQDYGAIEVRVGDGDWQPALGRILPLVDGRTKVQFRGTSAGGAAVVLAAEFYNAGTPIENVNTIDTDGNVTNANGEVVGSVPIYDVAESGFSFAWWMWLLAGLAALVLLTLVSLFWRKRMSALTDNGSTGDRTEKK